MILGSFSLNQTAVFRTACGKLPAVRLISQLMTVSESVLLAPREVLDARRGDLPLSIMPSFKQEMASGIDLHFNSFFLNKRCFPLNICNPVLSFYAVNLPSIPQNALL